VPEKSTGKNLKKKKKVAVCLVYVIVAPTDSNISAKQRLPIAAR
jgi:hypothetical protein